MLNCDVYGISDAGGFGDDGLYCFTYDLHQTGEVSPEYEPVAERNQTSDGGYAMYAIGKNEKSMTLHFIGTQEQINNVTSAAKYGEIAISGIYTGAKYTPSFDTGAFCYVDGAITTTLISPHIDLMSADIPVIIRDENTKVPVGVLKYQNEYQVKFGNLLIPLAECKYIGGGMYEHPEMFEMVGTANQCVIMCNTEVTSAFTAKPTVHIINEDTGETTSNTFVFTEKEEDAYYVAIPGSGSTFTVVLSVEPMYKQTFKPFILKFRVYRW